MAVLLLRSAAAAVALTGSPPAAPTLFDITAVSQTGATGHYTASPGTGVTHTLGVTPAGGGETLYTDTGGDFSGGTFTVTGLTPGVDYTFRMKASSVWGVSAWTPDVVVTTPSSADAPNVDFTADTTGPAVGDTVTFTNLTTGLATLTYAWTFGDGGTSTATDPTHVYASAGTYTVALTATNVAGTGTKTRANYILTIPVADFTATPLAAPAGTYVTITNASTGTVASISVDWGDGTVNSSLSHQYVDPAGGTYTVALTATNASGSNTKTRTNYVTTTAVHLFADSVNGNDANAGTTVAGAVATWSRLQTLWTARGAGTTVGLAYGSYWRETLTPPADTYAVVAYGNPSLATPRGDGADVATGWANVGGATPDVWSLSWTRGGPIIGQDTLGLWADDARPRLASSLADLQTNGGWYATNRIALTTTVYVKSVANPNTSGVLYEVTRRNYGLLAHPTITGATRTGTVTGPLELRRYVSHYNAWAAGPGDGSQILCREGSIHHLVTDTATTEDVVCSGMDVSLAGQNPYTAYGDNNAGRTHTATRAIIVATAAELAANAGFLAHGSTAAWDAVTYDQCVISNTSVGFGADATGTVTVQNSAVLDGYGLAKPSSPTVALLRSACRGVGNTSRRYYEDGGIVDTRAKTRTVKNVAFYTTAVSQLGAIYLGVRDGTLLVEKCVFYFTGAVNGRVIDCERATAAGLTVTVKDCLFVVDAAQRQIRMLNSDIVYVGTNNWFVSASAFLEIGANLYTGPTTWAAALAALGNGSSETGFHTGAVSWVGSPAAGDFRLTPGSAAQLAGVGPQEHWDFTTRAAVSGPPTRWPTPPASLAEQRSYVRNPSGWSW